VKAGKARYIGASSQWSWQFMKALALQRANGWSRYISMQNHLNLLYREEEREMLPLCISERIGVIPWSPLARGKLARPWEESPSTQRGATDEFGKNLYAHAANADRVVVERVQAISKARGIPAAQIGLAWHLHKPGITSPIVGATKPAHLKDAIAAVEVDLSAEEIKSLEEAYVPHPVAGFS
jgi:aryl-alcohol dehydrogenase-like predicted oxidoreductase